MSSLIYLLRHAEIDRSRPRRFLGRTDLPLNDNGIRQAKEVGRSLAAIPFDQVFSSPLTRAMRTAVLVSGRSMATIKPVAAFREINLGAWEGLSAAEVRQRFPGAYEQRGMDMEHFRPTAGESFADVAARALPALLDIAQTACGPVLIVAHAGVNRVLLSCLLHRPLGHLLEIPQDYTGINILEKTPHALTVTAVNIVSAP